MIQRDHYKRKAVHCSVALTILLSACTRFEHVPPQASIGRSRLEVYFATPTELVGRTPGGEEVMRSRVRRIVGRPLEVRGDSLVLEVRGWVGAEGGEHTSRPFVAVIPVNDACVDVGTRRFSGRRTAMAVLAVPAAVLLFGLYCGGRQGCDPLY